MIQGTTSNAGKTMMVAGLCRVFAQDGYEVSPFKAQNIALNSFITEDGLEMGRAQVVQAEACYKKPIVEMNPILLKPTGNRTTQVVLNGKSIGNMSMYDYKSVRKNFVDSIESAFNKLCKENDIIVIEGAGSPAEININKEDLVNMGMAKMAKSPVIIVGDIDRGGVFASLYGTCMLLDDESKGLIKGTIINKFRGDIDLLINGIEQLEQLIDIKSLGVVPFMDVVIDEEDGLSDIFTKKSETDIDIVVIHLPKISNYTDFGVFPNIFNIDVRYVRSVKDLKKPDLIIIPGTKNTIKDLKWLRQTGLEAKILNLASNGIPIFGVCGGYQMLTQTICDPMCVESGGEITGLGLLDGTTIFCADKKTTQISGVIKKIDGIFKGLKGKKIKGYEIHMGVTNESNGFSDIVDNCGNKKVDGGNSNNVYGTYIHGIFDSVEFTEEIIRSLYEKNGLQYNGKKDIMDIDIFKDEQYNKLANTLRQSLDIKGIYKILEAGV